METVLGPQVFDNVVTNPHQVSPCSKVELLEEIEISLNHKSLHEPTMLSSQFELFINKLFAGSLSVRSTDHNLGRVLRSYEIYSCDFRINY